MPSFGKRRGLRNSHEMRLFGMAGMGLLISPSLRTYNTNIEISRGSIFMYAFIFWVTLVCDSTSLPCGAFMTLDFMMLIWSMSVKVKVPNE